MKNMLIRQTIAGFILLALFLSCNNIDNSMTGATNSTEISFVVKARSQSNSIYRITVSGSSMKTIGPDEYEGGRTIRMYVPPGAARRFYFERFDSSRILTDTGTTIVDVGAGQNIVEITLENAKPEYSVIYIPGNDVSGSAPIDSVTYPQGDTIIVKESGTMQREDYSFLGWSIINPDSSTGEISTVDTIIVGTSEIKLYAVWTQSPAYSITFHKNAGSAVGIMEQQQIAKNATAKLFPNRFSRSGWTFAGWSMVPDGEVRYEDGMPFTMDSSDVSLYAQWMHETYTVTFHKNDEDAAGTMEPQSIAAEQTIELAANEYEKEGWSFAGWSATPNGEVVYENIDLITMGSSDVELYAQWTANDYTITFNKNDDEATGTMDTQSIPSESTEALKANQFSKEGWSFAGWAVTPDDKIMYSDETNITMGSENLTLYAQWTQNPMYSVTFDKNDADASGSMTNQSMVSGATIDLSPNSYEKTGWMFTGWAITANGPVVYEDCAQYTMNLQDDTLYAVWEINTYEIVFDKNDDLATGTMPSTSLVFGLNSNLPGNIFQKNGWTFTGWAVSPDGEIAYADRAEYTMGAGDITLYAQWEIIPTYSVTYDGNGNTGGEVPTDTNFYRYGETVSVRGQNDLIKTGHSFKGWYLVQNGSQTTYQENSTFEIGAEDVVLSAKWAIDTCTVSFESNGGSIVNSQKVVYDLKAQRPSAPAKTGYVFEEWYADSLFTGVPYDFSLPVRENIVLYATWSPVYSVTYHPNGDDVTGEAPTDNNIYNDGDEAVIRNENTLRRTGYSFGGWNTRADTTGTNYVPGQHFEIDKESLVLYAKWQPVPYNITYILNGGIGNDNPAFYTIETPNIPLLSPERADFIFKGWFTDSSLSTQILEIAKGTIGDIFLYAKWEWGGSSVIDIDGNEYPTAQIGNQVWTTVNLRVTRYNDGDSLQHINDDSIWEQTDSGAYCFCRSLYLPPEQYGALYNWHAVNTNKLAPDGWQIPTISDWDVLADYLGDDTIAGNMLKENAIGIWAPGYEGTDDFDFSAFPAGFRHTSGDPGAGCWAQDFYAFWWSSTAANTPHEAYHRQIDEDGIFEKGITDIRYGYSVRLVKIVHE